MIRLRNDIHVLRISKIKVIKFQLKQMNLKDLLLVKMTKTGYGTKMFV